MSEVATPLLERAATALAKVRAQIAKADARIKPMREAADALELEIKLALIDSKLESFGTKSDTYALKRNTIASLTDDKAFFAYVGKNKAWDLVRKQPVIAACKARWDEGIEVPGVTPEKVVSLSITARKKK